jgi:hypothetical protein
MPRRRGQTQYGEEKRAALFAGLTYSGLQQLDYKIGLYDPKLSRSEFLERLGRGTLEGDRLVEIFCDGGKCNCRFTESINPIPKVPESRQVKG